MALVDKLTADYLASTAPDPTQASLDAVLGKMSRVQVIDGGMVGDKALGTAVLMEASDHPSLDRLRAALAIVEDPDTFGHCMCLGGPTLRLYAGDDPLATIGIHHGVAIRWNAWKHDAHLWDSGALRFWLAERGVPGPQQEFEDAQRRAAEQERAAMTWLEAMPACLKPFWQEMQGFEVNLAALSQALSDAYPAQAERIRSLFHWFGSGAGPWSGFPMYEGVAEKLLLQYPTQALVAALQGSSLTRSQMEGAARLFAGWDFSRQRRRDRLLLPEALRQRLLEHALSGRIQDNVERAQRAFQG